MNLNDWIKEHRAEFDQATAPDGIWSEFKTALPPPKPKRSIWLYTAAAILLVSFGLWRYLPESRLVPKPLPMELLPQSFLAQEAVYQLDLKSIEAQIDFDTFRDNDEFEWVFEELKTLEEINAKYRKDLTAPVPREELLEVLMDYYEKRLRLLRKLQMELKRNQNKIDNENFSL
jgi:hypothetical protein